MSTNTNLCLACSSSLPPKAYESAFYTKCCRRPICPSCLSSNPRLARYDPCLACLSGVGVVGHSGAAAQSSTLGTPVNIDGGLKDEDTFVLGSDDDDDEDDSDARGPPPAYEQVEPTPSSAIIAPETAPADAQDAQPDSPDVRHEADGPLKYYLKRGDTLQGISFKFSVDGDGNSASSILYPLALLAQHPIFYTLAHSSYCRQPRVASSPHRRRPKKQHSMKPDWRVARAYIALA
ncbi:hypothetical protein EV121DRAFT_263001, partial [Schizophyllum commune]